MVINGALLIGNVLWKRFMRAGRGVVRAGTEQNWAHITGTL